MIYAVKPGIGRIPGLYPDRMNASNQGKYFRSFLSIKDALKYVNPKGLPYHEIFPQRDYYLYTDGSCYPEQYTSFGPGGWSTAIIDKNGSEVIEMAGGAELTTATEMELTAIIRGLEYIEPKKSVHIFTDSVYIFDALRNYKLLSWSLNNFKFRTKRTQYAELWKEVNELLKEKKYQIHWIKGHARIGKNDRCDQLAKLGAQRYAKEKG